MTGQWRRRDALAAILTAVGLAGCLGDEGSERETAPNRAAADREGGTRAEGDDETTKSRSAEGEATFRQHLEREGIAVESLDVSGETVSLVYATDRTSGQALGDEIGTIAAGFVIAHDGGWTDERLNAVITDGADRIGRWHVRPEWIDQFDRGAMSAAQFNTKVIDTVEQLE